MIKSIAAFLLFALSLSFGSTGFAQTSKAKTLLDKVSSTVKKASGISANFSLSVNNAKGVSQMKQTGSFKMKHEMYSVLLKGGQEIYCDAHSVWTYFPANKEVQLASYAPEEQTISPAQLLSGSYEKDYNYTYSGSKTLNGIRNEVVTLTPKKKADFSKIELYIDPAKNMVTGGKAYISGGRSYTYSISNVNTKASFSNSDFKFNKKTHPGVEVIDVRF